MVAEPAAKSDEPTTHKSSGTTGPNSPWRDWLIDISSLSSNDLAFQPVKVDLQQPLRAFTAEKNKAFWKMCDEDAGPGRELDWEEHLKSIHEAHTQGLPEV